LYNDSRAGHSVSLVNKAIRPNIWKEFTMNVSMSRSVLSGKWKQVRGKVKQTWGKLTDNDLDRINGRIEELTGVIQERYGYTHDQAEREVDRFIEQVNMK